MDCAMPHDVDELHELLSSLKQAADELARVTEQLGHQWRMAKGRMVIINAVAPQFEAHRSPIE
jgi:hypothetical protein